MGSTVEEEKELNKNEMENLIEFEEIKFGQNLCFKNFHLIATRTDKENKRFSSPTFVNLGFEWYAVLRFTQGYWYLDIELTKLLPDKTFEGKVSIDILENNASLSKFNDILFSKTQVGNFFARCINIGNEKWTNSNYLKIKIEIKILEEIINEGLKRNKYNSNNNDTHNIIHFNRDLRTEFTDFEILVDGNVFKIHKIFMAAQSDVFHQMLTSDFKETKENQLKIEDFSLKTVKIMTEFLYSGLIEGWPQENSEIFELLKIADKYQIIKMKEICQGKLFELLSLDNFAELLIFANIVNSPELKDDILKFGKRNISELSKMDDFKEKAKKHPAYFLEIFVE